MTRDGPWQENENGKIVPAFGNTCFMSSGMVMVTARLTRADGS